MVVPHSPRCLYAELGAMQRINFAAGGRLNLLTKLLGNSVRRTRGDDRCINRDCKS